MSKPTISIVASSIVYVLVLLAAMLWVSDPLWIQTIALGLTGAIVILYTHETSLLRRATYAQLELQLRPFIVVELRDSRFELRNVGVGVALNIKVSDVTINASEKIFIRFPEPIPVLEASRSAAVTARSFYDEADAGDFFVAHLESQYALSEHALQIQFQNANMETYQVTQKAGPDGFEIVRLDPVLP